MSTAAVIGAGSIGGAIAHKLAERDCFRTVRLIDPAGQIASGKALDIQQAASAQGFATRVQGSADLLDALGARVVVLADDANPDQGPLHGDRATLTLRTVAGHDAGATVVCAAPALQRLVEHATRELRLPPTRVIGSAPEALVGALRALVALELDADPSDIALTVLGVPPDGFVVPWSQASVRGAPLHLHLSPRRLASLGARLNHLWPPGPYALASATARVCEAMVFGSRRVLSCLVVLPGDLGVRDRAIARPVRLVPGRPIREVSVGLTTHERVALDNALAIER